MNIHQERCENH